MVCALKRMLAVHFTAGIDIESRDYVRGIEAALYGE
jgi:hypothetical protein